MEIIAILVFVCVEGKCRYKQYRHFSNCHLIYCCELCKGIKYERAL
jgi:hypothetical protein